MSSSRLPHRITIQQKASGTDDYGQPNGTLADVYPGKIPAHVREVAGGEAVRGEQVESHITSVVEVARGIARPTTDMLVVFGDRTLFIDSVKNASGRTGRDVRMFLHCTEQA